MQDRTVILIAHRLSTVRDADCIFVFEQGHVVAKGRHRELLQSSPTYANLVRKQLDWQHEGDAEHPHTAAASETSNANENSCVPLEEMAVVETSTYTT